MAGQSTDNVRPRIIRIEPPEKDFFSKSLDFHGIPIEATEVVTSPSSLYTSGDTTVDALYDDFVPKNLRDVSHRPYGNWLRTGTQWVQYEWSQTISTKQIEVYWWDDRRGERLPKACRVKFWNGSDFVLMTNVTGLGVAGNQFNVTTFDEVQTSNKPTNPTSTSPSAKRRWPPNGAAICSTAF